MKTLVIQTSNNTNDKIIVKNINKNLSSLAYEVTKTLKELNGSIAASEFKA